MSTTVITFVALVIALLIVAWAVLLIYRRYLAQKKRNARAMHTWVPLQTSIPQRPTQSSSVEDADEEEEEERREHNARAQQNGHYSESRRNP